MHSDGKIEENDTTNETYCLEISSLQAFFERKFIRMEYIDTKEQLADIFTKPLPDDLFQRLRLGLCG